MTETDAPAAPTDTTASGDGWSTAAVVCGALGVLTAVWTFWMVVPGLVFGVAAIALGVRARRRSSPAAGSAAIALGVTALLLVPSVLVIVDQAEDWGRDCTLHPANHDC